MQSTLQPVLSTIDGFPWSLSVLVIVIAAMLIFREAIREIVGRSHCNCAVGQCWALNDSRR